MATPSPCKSLSEYRVAFDAGCVAKPAEHPVEVVVLEVSSVAAGVPVVVVVVVVVVVEPAQVVVVAASFWRITFLFFSNVQSVALFS